MKKIWSFSIFTFLSLVTYAQPIIITVSGSPSFNSSLVNISEAGNDFTNNIVESYTKSYLSITPSNFGDFFKNFQYKVTVYKSDINLNPLLKIEIKRDDDGIGGSYAKVENGLNWQFVTNTPAYFFEGKATRYNIPVSYRISNISVLIPADDYETTVIYTVYEE